MTMYPYLRICMTVISSVMVRQRMQLTRGAIIHKDYTDPKITNVSLVVSAHEDNGDN